MATMPSKFIKQLKLGSDNYELIAGFLNDGNGGAKDWADVEALVTAGFTIEVPWTSTDYISTTAPTAAKLATVPAVTVYYNNGSSTATGTLAASASGVTKHIYLIYHPHTIGFDSFDEYVSTGSAWEKIGNTDIDLSGYATKGTYTGSAAENGAHTHDVTGSGTVDVIDLTSKKLGISRSTDVALNTSSKSTVLTGVKVSTSDNVLGEATTFTTTVTPTTTNIKATASGTALSTSTDAVLGTGTTFNVTGGSLTGATQASYTQGTFSQGTLPSFTQGSQASWSATVDSNGVLSFNWATNGTDTWSAGTLPTHAADSFTKNSVGSVSAIGVTADTTADPVNALTAASVKTQPTIALATGATAGTGVISVATGITSASTSAVTSGTGSDIVAAATGVAGNGTASALTAVTVSAQPAFTLDGSASSGVDYAVLSGTTSTKTVDITGTAASDGAHTHSTTVTI